MKKLYLFIISFLCLLTLLNAQQVVDFNNYQTIQSSGKIPDDIIKLYIDKYNEDKKTIATSNNNTESINKDRYLQESNFFTNQYLISGKILFNDPITNYINVVVDTLLKNQPELRKKLRFYTLNSPYVNAEATDKGIVFVHLGLFAYINTEAQLAYILSHEIIHYVRKHNMQLYLDKDKIFNNEYADLDENFMKLHHRSREMETEADKYGLLDFFLKSNYSCNDLAGAMDILQYSYLPYKEVKFDKSYFETPYFKFPKTYRLDKLNPIKNIEDLNDTLSSHPNVKKRREAIAELIKDVDSNGRKSFIQPQETFNYIKKLARFECINQYINYQKYDEAIYNSYLMLKEYPTNSFLQKAMATSLYLLAKYKINDKLTRVITDYKKKEGESQQLNYLLKKFEKKDICIVALRTIWKLHKFYPNDVYITSIKDDLFKELFGRLNIKASDFSAKPREEKSNDPYYEALEKNRNKQGIITNENNAIEDDFSDAYFKFTLVDLFHDSQFNSDFNEYYNIAAEYKKKNKEQKENKYYDNENRQKTNQYFNRSDASANNINAFKEYDDLNDTAFVSKTIDEILVYKPLYLKIDERKKDVIRYIDTEQKQREYINKIKNITTKLKIKTKLLIPSEFNADDVESYNDFVLVNNWMRETQRFPENKNFVPYSFQFINPLIKKYNTRYINMSGVLSKRKKKGAQTYILAASGALLIYPLPYSVYTILVPDYYSVYFNTLFDLKTGKLVYNDFYSFAYKDRDDYLNSRLYYSFSKIKKRIDFITNKQVKPNIY